MHFGPYFELLWILITLNLFICENEFSTMLIDMTFFS